MDNWIEHLEVYFALYDYTSKENLTFATLKLFKHALSWWTIVKRHRKGGELLWKVHGVTTEEVLSP